ncbi:16S rRNA (guanine(527)-N(7))-methyltransferase RsmG [Alicyclobacillus cycloheptanicus]|uniref:Ribosomal RNA small subunit methyltransferase G n=1 Tax=Alicyclobacillus cycloheptanicus TaxID=1457 RepID=A0ABT9XKW0_9BACL|nr:16S rRNA (guanine(527)-N(7))-methyltransferase RsmG [Alicyclobacillus cycloheptanicus]MDQ0190945.1 16S rRNA (guanine527-N7)-methyltransferase [Alicyclobacillus cycloheptanicus]WDM02393.1 16S rRNA (guanine(527)-N(7))-methyltransferase RsmG [Alicyclobacillus cycloheptanicus]
MRDGVTGDKAGGEWAAGAAAGAHGGGALAWTEELPERQRRQFERYYEMLVDWNQRMNLTGITEKQEVYIKHFYDSVWIRELPAWREVMKPGACAVDVGTGAGFPGLALAICHSDCEFVLMDSLNKRVGFLQAVAAELGLSNVQVVHARAEDAGRDKAYRERFDCVLSRAVARLNVLMELMLPLVKVGGMAFAYKGPALDEELAEAEGAIQTLGGGVHRSVTFTLPQGAGTRTLLCVPKQRKTPAAYPRKAGVPQKSPLAPRG